MLRDSLSSLTPLDALPLPARRQIADEQELPASFAGVADVAAHAGSREMLLLLAGDGSEEGRVEGLRLAAGRILQEIALRVEQARGYDGLARAGCLSDLPVPPCRRPTRTRLPSLSGAEARFPTGSRLRRSRRSHGHWLSR